jgi:hypothetical protein
MSLLPLFQWASHTPALAVVRDSKWGFAVVEMVHLLALAALGGTVLVVDLGILGIGFRRRTPGRMERELAPIFVASLIAMVLSGTLLVGAEAMKCYYHPAFRLKMVLFAAAVLFHFTIYRTALGSPSIWSKIWAVASLTLWLAVGLAGRAIGFL